MKTIDINNVTLTEDSLKMLQHWQENGGEIHAEQPPANLRQDNL